ncbi:MAG: TetR/AcrR family transcriptional regulator [Sandaracinaceae bacterium]
MSDATDPARARILSAASELLSKLGPLNVGMRTIAKQAGVSVGLIHYHFDSKQGVLESSLEQLATPLFALEDTYLTRVKNGDALEPTLREAYLASFAVARRYRPLMRVILTLVGHTGALPRVWRTNALSAFLGRWADALHERTGVEPWVLRFRLHNVLALTTRYVAASEAELQTVLDDPNVPLEEARDRIAGEIAELAATWLTHRPPRAHEPG